MVIEPDPFPKQAIIPDLNGPETIDRRMVIHKEIIPDFQRTVSGNYRTILPDIIFLSETDGGLLTVNPESCTCRDTERFPGVERHAQYLIKQEIKKAAQ